MKLTIEIPNSDFVNPEMTPEKQVEHLFKLHHIRATVTPAEPSFREVMEYKNRLVDDVQKCSIHIKFEGCTRCCGHDKCNFLKKVNAYLDASTEGKIELFKRDSSQPVKPECEHDWKVTGGFAEVRNLKCSKCGKENQEWY